MLFNSFEFIFIFLIPVFIIFNLINNYTLKIWFLIIASIIFYSQWDMKHLLILLISILFNYYISQKLIKDSINLKKTLLISAISLNLLPLIYFKYSNFLQLTNEHLVLPLAISFFTFQQIAFLIDLYRKKIYFNGFKEYILFILFFPQLVAGPIVHYNDIIPQVKDNFRKKVGEDFVITGIILFSIGLFKKVVLADNFNPIVNQYFGNIPNISFYEAWIGILSYSFQIYFDFSGYADMAIGLALIFGIKLPINFNSPYKARNISEFWRNWHITLSNFLKDYIYIPLGGNKVKFSRQILNLLLTMSIGGIWHGAGINFLLWGFMHGLLLSIVHYFKNILKINAFFPKQLSIIITFFSVTLLWVLFRADTFENAITYYKILLNFDFKFISNFSLKNKNIVDIFYSETFLVICGFFIIWLLPNSLKFVNYSEKQYKFCYKKIFLSGILLFIALKSMTTNAAIAFVYFNF